MGNISKIRVGGVTYPLNDSSISEELRREVERAYTAEGEIKENILGIEARIDDLDNKISSGEEGDKELEERISEIEETIRKGDIVGITYSDLVNLRDNSELNPGTKYRITDYVTTTSQPNTQSAGHQFDIIVEALSENTLSEDAKAIQSENDGYFDGSNLEAWELKYCLDNDTSRFAWASVTNTVVNSKNVNIIDTLITDNEFNESFLPDYYIYVDTAGNKINEYVPGEDGMRDSDFFIEYGRETSPDGLENQLCIYKNDLSNEDYLEGGAEEGIDYADKFFYWGTEEVDGIIYDKWKKSETDSGWNITESGGNIFILTQRITVGEINSEETNNGKGVIYYMKDEFSNECPYDFKNIQFYPQEEYSHYLFTFSWFNENGDVEDLTLRQDLLSDDGTAYGTHDNIIKTYYNDRQILNNITFVSSYLYDSGLFYGCYSNSLGNNCYSNSLGNSCYSNIFGNDCTSNSLGDGCHSNSLGKYCQYNSFGNSCVSNSLSGSCYYNSFGNNCYNNRFDYNNCFYNSFGNNCISNSFGNDCRNNSLGEGCYDNSFGNSCYSNIFGNDCTSNSLGDGCYSNSFNENCTSNSFEDGCHSNSFGNSCESNHFGNKCYSNSFGNSCNLNIFGNNCHSNSFGDSCESNHFGNNCHSNSFNENCTSNSFGDSCHSNSFSNNCDSNNLGNTCHHNSFGNNCDSNSLGDYCISNSLGDYCISNNLGDDCYNNRFGNECCWVAFYDAPEYSYENNEYTYEGDELNFISNISLDNECSHLLFYPNSNLGTIGDDNMIKNITVTKGVKGKSSSNGLLILEIPVTNNKYELKIARNIKGDIKMYCEADLIG